MPGNHEVEVGRAVVVKRYRSWSHDEPRREWRALTLLAEYAPGLAPEPVRADLAAVPPAVVMTRLEGVPLQAPVRGRHLDELARAVDTLHRAVPAGVLRGVPRRAGHPRAMLDLLRRRHTSLRPPDASGPIAEAHAAAARWVARPDLERTLAEDRPPVLGTGDGNLANHLWDGTRVRIVDFEYAGRSDRAYELAEVLEHVTAWRTDALDAGGLLSRLPPTRPERARLVECRRLMALFWFQAALAGGSGAAGRPAERLLGLLDGCGR
jgi:Ser/Thr protein kinase RdoA (MazF antagonist)